MNAIIRPTKDTLLTYESNLTSKYCHYNHFEKSPYRPYTVDHEIFMLAPVVYIQMKQAY